MADCRSCGAAIIWAKSTTGNPMPLDAEPHGLGTILVSMGRARVLTGSDLEQARYSRTRLYRSHFATCPNANDHRRNR